MSACHDWHGNNIICILLIAGPQMGKSFPNTNKFYGVFSKDDSVIKAFLNAIQYTFLRNQSMIIWI
jgi:hypothetical protein